MNGLVKVAVCLAYVLALIVRGHIVNDQVPFAHVAVLYGQTGVTVDFCRTKRQYVATFGPNHLET